MRGGKREGAGRKGFGPSKSYWLPIAIEEQVLKLLGDYKQGRTAKPEEKPDFEKHRKSKTPVKPMFPNLTKEQKKRLRIWLGLHGFAKTQAEARKLTHNPRAIQETVLKYSEMAGEKYNWTIGDIIELYAVDD